MPFGFQEMKLGSRAAPSLPLVQSTQDDLDDVAVQFGSDLLVRIDPRDVRMTPDNPTGRRRIHYQEPNRDPLLFSGSGCSVSNIAGKYNGRPVFQMVPGSNEAINDLSVGPRSLNGVTEFSMMGVGHFEASMLGSGAHFFVGMYRDGATLESAFYHQFASGKDFLTIVGDQGDGGGANIDLTATTAVTAGVPFVYLWRVKGTSPANSLVTLHIGSLAAPIASVAGSGVPEGGSTRIYLGHLVATSAQWTGAHGRGYVFKGDILDAPDKAALAADLMLQLKTYYGIA